METTSMNKEQLLAIDGWVKAMNGFTSAIIYQKRVDQFLDYHFECIAIEPSQLLCESAFQWILYCHEVDPITNEIRFCANTLKTITSILKCYFESSQINGFSQYLTRIYRELDKWSKNEPVKKAFTFEEVEMAAYFETQHNPINLAIKFYVVIGKSFGSRGVEMWSLQFCDLVRYIDADKNVIYMIEYDRAKSKDAPVEVRMKGAVISGQHEIDIVEAYLTKPKSAPFPSRVSVK